LQRALLDPVQPEWWERVERWLGAAKPSVSSIITSKETDRSPAVPTGSPHTARKSGARMSFAGTLVADSWPTMSPYENSTRSLLDLKLVDELNFLAR
jgi:hypothetical protein